jgi:tetratricopeptide (TPR) repeat protein
MKKINVLISLVVVLSLMGGCSTTKADKHERSYTEARNYLQHENYTGAVEYLNKKIDETSTKTDNENEKGLWHFYFYRGFAFYYLKEYEKALSDFNIAQHMKDNYPLTYANRGNVLFKMERYDDALKDYQKALELFDVKKRERIIGGVIFQRFDKKGDSYIQDIFNSKLETKPGKAAVFYNMGFIYTKKKDLPKAEECYNNAIKTDGKYTPSFYARGILYLSQKRFEEALEDFYQVVRRWPNYPSVYTARGETFRAIGDLHGAHRDFTKAIALNSSFGRAYYLRSLVLKSLGFPDESGADLKKSEELGFKPEQYAIGQ